MVQPEVRQKPGFRGHGLGFGVEDTSFGFRVSGFGFWVFGFSSRARGRLVERLRPESEASVWPLDLHSVTRSLESGIIKSGKLMAEGLGES